MVDVGDDVSSLLLERQGTAATRTGPHRLLREPLDPATARRFFPALRHEHIVAFDPHCFFRLQPNLRMKVRFPELPSGHFLRRTNGRGLRNDAEVAPRRPHLRVLIAGDSHTEGVCDNAEGTASLLEQALGARIGPSVEVLNAAVGGHGIYHYAGILEAWRDLAPDCLVVVLYGGNDFSEAMALERYFSGRGPARRDADAVRALARAEGLGGLFPQELSQAIYFRANPSDEEVAVETACAMALEIAAQCREAGATPIFVYLPPALRGQPEHTAEERARVRDLRILTEHDLAVSDRIADRWIACLRDGGLAHLDLRPAFRNQDERLYWRKDHHINLAAHRLVASLLAPMIKAGD